MPIPTRQKGFSVIEAVMVMSILCLLAAVAVPSMLGSKDAAEKAVLVATLRSMHTDQISYSSTGERYARLSELNNFANGRYGEMSGSTLRNKNWIFAMTPTPTDATLRTQYQTLAYRMRNGTMEAAYSISEDGVIQALIP
jgi:general secretion pathway protein G